VVSRRAFPRFTLLVAALAGGLLLTSVARAETVTVRDNAGRPISFDVRAPDVDVEWYARVLRRAAHGNEIARVTFRIVEPEDLARTCGSAAAGCYRGGRSRAVIVLPSNQSTETAHTLLHEYGHHIDATVAVAGVREPNGTPSWWTARDMQRWVAEGVAVRDYSQGWSHAIGEIFAEDYAQLHIQYQYKIGWLSPPGAEIRTALKKDLEGAPATPSPPPPVELVRRGVIAGGETRTLPFGLLGPDRRVTFTVSLTSTTGAAVQARAELRCGSRSIVRSFGPTGTVTIQQRGLGPAQCEVALVSKSVQPQRYTAKLRLAVEV
jgi:hypothetical protein